MASSASGRAPGPPRRRISIWLTLALVGAGVAALARDPVFAIRLWTAGFARFDRCAPRRSASSGSACNGSASAIAGGFAALAGALYAFLKGSVFPDNLGIPLSIDGLAMVLLGGVDTVSGGVFGAAVYRSLSIWVISHTDYSRLVLGASRSSSWSCCFPQGPRRRVSKSWRSARRRSRERQAMSILAVEGLGKSYRGFEAVERCELRDGSRRDARADRTERRGQEHLLQHDQRPARADDAAASRSSAATPPA